ncbi:hypothetical protein HDK77DRAFT_166944 [Phyllosticta capitalensis]
MLRTYTSCVLSASEKRQGHATTNPSGDDLAFPPSDSPNTPASSLCRPARQPGRFAFDKCVDSRYRIPGRTVLSSGLSLTPQPDLLIYSTTDVLSLCPNVFVVPVGAKIVSLSLALTKGKPIVNQANSVSGPEASHPREPRILAKPREKPQCPGSIKQLPPPPRSGKRLVLPIHQKLKIWSLVDRLEQRLLNRRCELRGLACRFRPRSTRARPPFWGGEGQQQPDAEDKKPRRTDNDRQPGLA